MNINEKVRLNAGYFISLYRINRVLKPLKEIMAGEPSAKFLDLVSEVEGKAEKSRNSYSDVAVILSQYTQACEKYRVKYFTRVTDSKF